MTRKHAAAMAMLAAGIAVTIVKPAEAKIKCAEGYQSIGGAMLSTPYCRDNYVAAVARQYGMYAPDAKVRNNPNFKREICRWIGHDIRVKDACEEVEPSGRSRF